jgi:predicted MPP superfamily phosphohydrolase
MSPVRIVIFLSLITSLTYGTHYYLWARLIRDAVLPSPWLRIATIVLVLLAASVPTTMILSRMLPRDSIKPLSWLAFVWMGALFLLFLSTATVDALHKIVSLVASGPLADPARRLLFARGAAVLATAAGAALSGFAFWSAWRGAQVKRVRVKLAKLHPSLAGYKIVQLTDVHIGPTLDREFLSKIVDKVNAQSPDMVVITGDLVDGSVRALAEHVRPLKDLRAKDGVFFVTGNHEYYSGADEWIAYLRTLNVRVLRNERVAIGGDNGFDLAGVDDSSAHQFGGDHGADYHRALSGRDTSRPVVLLAHQPRQVLGAEPFAPDLMLSGHTHGGQIAPINFLVKLQQPYVAGLYDHGSTQVYVSCGTGYWGPPMRLGAPAEISHIELHCV